MSDAREAAERIVTAFGKREAAEAYTDEHDRASDVLEHALETGALAVAKAYLSLLSAPPPNWREIETACAAFLALEPGNMGSAFRYEWHRAKERLQEKLRALPAPPGAGNWREIREECAKIAENMDFFQGDFGEPAEGKLISGFCMVDNRGPRTPQHIADAIRALPPPSAVLGDDGWQELPSNRALPQAMADWKPIDTAPKCERPNPDDYENRGPRILLYFPDIDGEPYVSTGWWRWQDSDSEGRWHGFYTEALGTEANFSRYYTPTHWKEIERP